MPSWPLVRFSTLLTRVRRREPVVDGMLYPTVSVLMEGQGLGAKEPFVGGQTGYDHLYRVCSGDVVLRTITAFESPVTVAYPEHDNTFVSQVFFTYTVDTEKILADYLRLIFQTPFLWQEMRNRAQGTVLRRKTISNDEFLNIAILLPSIPEQRRIIDLATALDVQIAAMEVEEAGINSLLSALREKLVAGSEWEPIRAMAEPNGIQIGPFGSQLHAYDYIDKGVPVVMPQDIIDGEIVTSKIKYIAESTAARLGRHRLRPGDLLLPRRGDLTKHALVKVEQNGWLCGTGCIRIRLVDPSLSAALLEGLSNARTDEWLAANAVGTTMLNLNTEIVSKLPAPKFGLSDRELAEACVGLHRMLRLSRTERRQLSLLRQQLLAQLLQGDIELPDYYSESLHEAV